MLIRLLAKQTHPARPKLPCPGMKHIAMLGPAMHAPAALTAQGLGSQGCRHRVQLGAYLGLRLHPFDGLPGGLQVIVGRRLCAGARSVSTQRPVHAPGAAPDALNQAAASNPLLP